MDWFLYDWDLRHEKVNRKMLENPEKTLKYREL